jgi:hypothetical protein
MQKPIHLRKETWQFLQHQFKQIPPPTLIPLLLRLGYKISSPHNSKKAFEKVIEKPGNFLVYAGILERADLLEKTVVSDEIGQEFMISSEGALQLQMKKEPISLVRIYDHHTQLMTRSQVIQFLTQNDTFDQMELKA